MREPNPDELNELVRHEAPHAINLFDMHQKYADVLGIDEVVGHLDTLRPQAAVPA